MHFSPSLRTEKFKGKITESQIRNPFWGWFWYISGLLFLILISSYISWGAIDIPLRALPMLSMVAVLYIALLFNRNQTDSYRSYRTIGLSIFYTTVGYLGIFALLAIFRFPFSRSFLLTSYCLTIIWMTVSLFLFGKNHPYYLIIKGGVAKTLRWIGRNEWDYQDTLPQGKSVAAYDGIVVDLHAHDDKELFNGLASSSLYGVPIVHAASVFENYSGRTHLSYIAEEGFYNLTPSRVYAHIKRVLEVGSILLCMPFILPLALVTALAIKIDSRGSVLFTQERIGRNGNIFTLYKFRSMITDAEKDGARFADEEDQRVTNLGKFIRKFRIDEIPQFWNVLKGDMSLIGPRPEQESFVEFFEEEIPFYTYRHSVRPGITGWAQIKDGYAADLESTEIKLEYDLYYIKNLSLSLDLLVIYATIKTVLTGFGSR